jgi:hypothetical protein
VIVRGVVVSRCRFFEGIGRPGGHVLTEFCKRRVLTPHGLGKVVRSNRDAFLRGGIYSPKQQHQRDKQDMHVSSLEVERLN